MMKKNCEQCGAEFSNERKTARFCSDKCRKAFSRTSYADKKIENVRLTDLRGQIEQKVSAIKPKADKSGQIKANADNLLYDPKHNCATAKCGKDIKDKLAQIRAELSGLNRGLTLFEYQHYQSLPPSSDKAYWDFIDIFIDPTKSQSQFIPARFLNPNRMPKG